MSEASKLSPAPLDAYESAKPDEPIFTLQGGDPLGAPLVRLWAYLARVRAGLPGDVCMIDAPIYVAKTTSIEHDPEKRKDLLLRASQAEQVSWHMDGYRRGEITHEAEVASVGDLEKLDLYDVRRRFVARLNNSIAELVSYSEELAERKFMEGHSEFYMSVKRVCADLESIRELVEIRREQ